MYSIVIKEFPSKLYKFFLINENEVGGNLYSEDVKEGEKIIKFRDLKSRCIYEFIGKLMDIR